MKKNYGKPKSAKDLVRNQKQADVSKQSSCKRNTQRNFFPFTPPRPGCWNPLGLVLDRNDCKILAAVQKGAKTIPQICEIGHITPGKVRDRLATNPDLMKGFGLLVRWKLAIAAPGKADELIEDNSVKGKELYWKAMGIIDEPSVKLIQNFGDDRLLTPEEIRYLTVGGR